MRASQKRTLVERHSVLALIPMSPGSTSEPSAEQHRRAAPSVLGFAVLTVSDSRAERDDASGDAIREMVSGAGHRLVDSTLVRDDVAAIRDAVRRLLATDGVDVLVTTGGTGFSP